jgi:hypothetical protein
MSKRKRDVTEDDSEDMVVEEEEEDNEENDNDGRPTSRRQRRRKKRRARSDDETTFTERELEVMCIKLAAEPENRELRAYIERAVRRCYIQSSGTLVVDKTDPITTDLTTLTNQEIINVIDNMRIQMTRTRKSELVERAIGTIHNTMQLFARKRGKMIPETTMNQLASDSLLRESCVALFLGQNFTLSPLTTAAISVAYHFTTFLLNITTPTNAQSTQPRPPTPAQTNVVNARGTERNNGGG